MKWTFYAALQTLACCTVEAQNGAYFSLSLLGQPVTPPRFHIPSTSSTERKSVSTLLFIASSQNIVAALYPRDGTIAWRQQFEEDIVAFYLHQDRVLVRSSRRENETTLSLFHAKTGFLWWQSRLDGTYFNIVLDENGIYATSRSSAIKVDQDTGDTLWTAHHAGSSTQHLRLSPPGTSSDTITLLLFENGQRLSMLPLDALSGRPRNEKVVCREKAVPESVLALDASRAVYLDPSGSLRSLCLVDNRTLRSAALSDQYVSIESINLESSGLFLARRKNHSAVVVQLGNQCTVSSAWDFVEPFSDAMYVGTIDRADQAHITRLHYSPALHMTVMSTYSAAAIDSSSNETGTVHAATIPYDVLTYGHIDSFAIELVPDSTNRPEPVSRSVYATRAGTLQLWRESTVDWVRQDGLAAMARGGAAIALDARERPSLSFYEKGMLAIFWSHARRTLHGFEELARKRRRSLSQIKEIDGIDGPPKDWLTHAFGHRQLLVLGTPTGKLLAFDLSAGGVLLWETLPFGGSTSAVKWHALTLTTEGDHVMAVAEIETGEALVAYAFTFDVQTGLLTSAEPHKLFSGRIVSVLMLPASGGAVAVLDANYRAHLYPPFGTQNFGPSLYFALQTDTRVVSGYRLTDTWRNGSPLEQQWSYRVPPDEAIVALVPATKASTASQGKVLGDRTTLYKFLDPHLVAVIGSRSISLIDCVSGIIIFRSSHDTELAVGSTIVATLSSNGLIYSFADRSIPGTPSKIISIEMYTQEEANATFSSFASLPRPQLFSRSFVYPAGIKALHAFSTAKGITSSNLILINAHGSIESIPRRLLDPRRPLIKPSKLDMEEGLVAYDPLIPLEPRFSLSAGSKVFVDRHPLLTIVPTMLESTSLVLSLGCDVFVGHASPSGTYDVLSEDFNKVQLLLVVAALALGILVTRPMVLRNQLRAKWYGD